MITLRVRYSTLRCGAAWALVLAWAGTIFYLSSLSGEQIEPYMLRFPEWDKICHMLAFGTGALVLTFAMRSSTGWRMRLIMLLVVLAISAFGASDEWHQLYTPHRSGADVWDWLADCTGATLGCLTTYAGIRINRSTMGARPRRRDTHGN